jgi:hypothetical protein
VFAINIDIRNVVFEYGRDIDLGNTMSGVARWPTKNGKIPLGRCPWRRRSTSKSRKPQHGISESINGRL